jgi:hypothetical protein
MRKNGQYIKLVTETICQTVTEVLVIKVAYAFGVVLINKTSDLLIFTFTYGIKGRGPRDSKLVHPRQAWAMKPTVHFGGFPAFQAVIDKKMARG